jgi:tRNA dimethylallyltransferase
MAMANPSQKPVALIAGPTASGKTALALALAKRIDSVIINADSAQVYADLPILSAAPSADELAQAPHRLFGYLDGAGGCSAAQWAADAKAECNAAWAAGRLPVLVGGTGLYLNTLLFGIAPIPEIDAKIRGEVRAMDVASSHAALRALDPIMAEKLAPTDTTRVARALEVVRATGRSISAWREERVGGIGGEITLSPLLLLPPRDWLYARCDARFAAMVAAGALEEVRALLAHNLPPETPVMRAIGVPELAAHLGDEILLDEAITLAAQSTRRYAKRQFTWFRGQSPAEWPRHAAPLNANLGPQIETILHNLPLT